MEDLTQKIVALLAKAETTTPGEAEAIMAKVDDLMARYQISQAALDAARVARGDKITGFTEVQFVAEGSYQHPVMSLMVDVAEALNCHGFYSSAGGRLYVTLAGRTTDIDHAKLLIASLQIQASRAMKADRNSFVKLTLDAGGVAPGPKAKYQRGKSFLYGFGAGAAAKIVETRTKLLREQPEAAQKTVEHGLVLAKTELDKWYHAKHPNLRTRSLRYGKAGHDAGVVAGKQADVGQARLGHSAKELGK